MLQMASKIEERLDSVKLERDEAVKQIDSLIKVFYASHQQTNPNQIETKVYGSMASNLAIE